MMANPDSRAPKVSRWAAPILAALAFAAPLCAQDEIRTTSNITVKGTLKQYDERGIAIRTTDGRVITYKPEEVAEVKARFSPEHRDADRALGEQNYDLAVDRYRKALDSESRTWALERIRTGLVRALFGAGNLADAGQYFLELAKKRDDAALMSMAPLVWRDQHSLPAAAHDSARRWLFDADPMAQLIGASWLLESDERKQALEVLEKLSTFNEQRISWIARAQRWRTATKPDPEEIERFATLIDKMPASIRGGPQYLLAQAYERAGMHVEASLSFLWVVFVYKPGTELEAESLLRAAVAAQQAGLADDARKLFDEVVEKHEGTSWASTAKKHLSTKKVPTE